MIIYGINPALEALRAGTVSRLWVRAEAGARVDRGLRRLAAEHATVGEIRGAGLMRGFEVAPETADGIVAAGLERGVIVNRTAGTVVRLLPPLTISDADIDEGLARLSAALGDVS